MELFIILTGMAFGFMLTGFIFLETNILSTKHDLTFPITLLGTSIVPLLEVMFTQPQYTQWVVGINSIGFLCLALYRSSEPKTPI